MLLKGNIELLRKDKNIGNSRNILEITEMKKKCEEKFFFLSGGIRPGDVSSANILIQILYRCL